MKGFKATGRGMSSGFKYPTHMGFTGSTGGVMNVSGYTRRKFADGGFVNTEHMEKGTLDEGSAMIRRARSSNNLDEVSGGKTPIRPGYKTGGWIAGATKNKGALHRALGVPEGQKIPAKKMAKAAKSNNPTMRKRAALAKTLGKMHKADGGEVSQKEPMAGRRDGLSDSFSKRGPIKKADGGYVPRRSSGYTLGQSVAAIPEALKELLRSATVSKVANQGAGKEISGRQKQIDDYVDEAQTGKTASNYARGGRMKKAGGGLSQMLAQSAAMRGAPRPAMMPTQMGMAPPQRMQMGMPTRVALPIRPGMGMARAKGGGVPKKTMTRC